MSLFSNKCFSDSSSAVGVFRELSGISVLSIATGCSKTVNGIPSTMTDCSRPLFVVNDDLINHDRIIQVVGLNSSSFISVHPSGLLLLLLLLFWCLYRYYPGREEIGILLGFSLIQCLTNHSSLERRSGSIIWYSGWILWNR